MRARVIIAAICAVLGAAGIVAPPLLLGGHKTAEWTLLPAAARTFTPAPDWPGYDCRSIGDGWRTCAQHGHRERP